MNKKLFLIILLFTLSINLLYALENNTSPNLILSPHYYYDSREVLYYSKDQRFDAIKLDLIVDTNSPIYDLEIYDIEPNYLKDKITLIKKIVKKKELIGSSEIISTDFFKEDTIIYLGLIGKNKSGDNIRMEAFLSNITSQEDISLKSIGKILYKDNYQIGIISFLIIFGAILFMLYKNKKFFNF